MYNRAWWASHGVSKESDTTWWLNNNSKENTEKNWTELKKKKKKLAEIKNAQEEVNSKLDDTKEQINELKEYWKSPKLKSKKNFF